MLGCLSTSSLKAGCCVCSRQWHSKARRGLAPGSTTSYGVSVVRPEAQRLRVLMGLGGSERLTIRGRAGECCKPSLLGLG